MGQARRRREQTEVLRQKGLDTVHPLLPAHVRQEYGPEFVNAIETIDRLTLEYDALIDSRQLPFDEVGLYVTEIGLIEELQKLIPVLVHSIRQVADVYHAQNAIQDLKAMDEVLMPNPADRLKRPLFMSYVNDAITLSRSVDYERVISEHEQAGQSLPELVAINRWIKRKGFDNLTTDEMMSRDAMARFTILEITSRATCRYLRSCKEKGLLPEEVFAAVDPLLKEGDRIATTLRGLDAEPTTYEEILSEEGPIRSLRVQTEKKHGNVLAYIGVLSNQTTSFGKTNEYSLNIQMSISRLTGDLVLSPMMHVSPIELFKQYGIEDLWPYIRLQALRLFEKDIVEGKVQLKSESSFQKRIIEIIAPVADSEGVTEVLPEAVSDSEVYSFPETTPHDVQEITERRAKAERLRTVHYRKAVSALGRLGVTLESGGRHMKARYGEKTAAFPNSHAGKNADITYILRSVLEILGITEEDFIEKL